MQLKSKIKKIIYKINPDKKCWDVSTKEKLDGWYSVSYKKRHMCWVADNSDLLILSYFVMSELIRLNKIKILCKLIKK